MKSANFAIISTIIATISTSAFATGQNIVASKEYVDTEIATKQPALAGSGSNVAVTYPTTAGGTPNSRTIGTTVTTGTNLVTTGGVNTALNNKQQKINAPANTVVTYTGTSGGTGSKAIYDSSGSYAAGNLAEVGHVNAAVAAGFNAHLTCADLECTLYDVNQLSDSNTYVPHNVSGGN